MKNLRPAGYAGKLGYASAGAAADFIIVNMVAEAHQRVEDAEGGDGAGAEARRALLQGLTTPRRRRSGLVRGSTRFAARVPQPGRSARRPLSRRSALDTMTFLERLQNNRNALGLLFMLPAAVLLLCS